MWTTNYFHYVSSMQTATYQTNERRKKPQIYSIWKNHCWKTILERLQLRYRDVCKRDMKELNINMNKWEELATDHSKCRSYLQVTYKVTASENKHRLQKVKLKTANLVVASTVTNSLDL